MEREIISYSKGFKPKRRPNALFQTSFTFYLLSFAIE